METSIIDLYADYGKKDRDKLVGDAFKKYLYDYYVSFSSINTINNDSRSYNLYKMTVALTIATVSTFCAFIPYQLNDLDKSNHTKPIKVQIVGNQGNHLEEKIMTFIRPEPPSPPPPPPPRNIRGSVPKPQTPPPPSQPPRP